MTRGMKRRLDKLSVSVEGAELERRIQRVLAEPGVTPADVAMVYNPETQERALELLETAIARRDKRRQELLAIARARQEADLRGRENKP